MTESFLSTRTSSLRSTPRRTRDSTPSSYVYPNPHRYLTDITKADALDRLLGSCDRRPPQPQRVQTRHFPQLHLVQYHQLRSFASTGSAPYANHHCLRVGLPLCSRVSTTNLDRREPDELVIFENSTTWEFTPYEFGSWAFGSVTKVRGAFTPVEYLGTRMNNGQVNGSCYKGFDQMR
jgi:hypothetical protein